MAKYQIQEKTSDGMVDIEPVTNASYVTSSAISGKDNVEDAISYLSTSVSNVASTVENGVVSDVTVSGSGSSGRVNVTKGGTTTALTVPYATKAGSLSNTTAIGSSSVPVYVNASGAPTAMGYNLETMTTNISNAKSRADSAYALAEGRAKALSFDTYEDMVRAVNIMERNYIKVGDNIYIGTLDVPDVWVSAMTADSKTYKYSSDSVLADELKSTSGVQIGVYTLKALETNKVDLTDYVTKKYTGTIAASTSGNAATATKATQDENGKNIASTYAEKTGVVGGVKYTPTTNTISVVNGKGEALTSFTPANDKVKTVPLTSSNNADYAVVLVTGSTVTSTITDSAYKYSGLLYNPSTSTVTATNFNGKAATATKLANARKITVTVKSGTNKAGLDISGSNLQTFDGTQDKTFEVTLGNSGVMAGTYSAIQVNEKGIVLAGGQMLQIAQSTSETPSASLAVGGLFFKKLS